MDEAVNRLKGDVQRLETRVAELERKIEELVEEVSLNDAEARDRFWDTNDRLKKLEERS